MVDRHANVSASQGPSTGIINALLTGTWNIGGFYQVSFSKSGASYRPVGLLDFHGD